MLSRLLPSRASWVAAVALAVALGTLISLAGILAPRGEEARSIGVRPDPAAATTALAAGSAASARSSVPDRPTSRPVRIRVDGLDIDAPIDPVGVGGDGTMELPPDGRRVGWYRFGPAPGARNGSAVLAGHVDTRTQGRGVLFPLSTARIGDTVTITRANGTDLVYRVVARQLIDRGQLPVAELFGRDGAPRLTVITCGGSYERGKGYSDNVVVTAVPMQPAVPMQTADPAR